MDGEYMRTISQTPRKKSPPQALRVFLILPENNEMTQEQTLLPRRDRTSTA